MVGDAEVGEAPKPNLLFASSGRTETGKGMKAGASLLLAVLLGAPSVHTASGPSLLSSSEGEVFLERRLAARVATPRMLVIGFKTISVSWPPIFIIFTASVFMSALRSCLLCFSVFSASGPQKYFW
jgi:hypothetical protein